MSNFRAVYPVDFTTSQPPGTFRTGHVYELDENPSPEFFEPTDDPVTAEDDLVEVDEDPATPDKARSPRRRAAT
jgi:hypothetical protein